MPRPPRVRAWAGYAIASAITIVTAAVQHELLPWVALVPYILFFLAVFLSSWIGGRGPGFLSIGMAAVFANYHFLPPENAWSTSPRALLLTGLFLVVSTVVNLLSGGLRDAIEQVERSEALLRAAIDQLPAGVVLTDSRGELLSSNQEMERILGSPKNVTASVPRGLHPDGSPYAPEEWPLARSLRAGEVVSGEEVELTRPDGTHGFASMSATPVRARNGDLIAAVGVAVDVTERRRVLEMLRDTDRRKTEFLAVLSHELRNPLAPIRNSLYLLAHAAPGSETALRARAVIERQVDHLTRLVDDLLDVARLSRGRVELRPEPVELNAVVAQAVEDCRFRFEQQGIGLMVSLGPRPLWVDGDAVRLAQVVGNLLQNAAKFTSRGGRAQIAVSEHAADGVSEIRVADTGVGFSAEIGSRLFEPFAQADTSLDRSGGGLGLGLALVKALVDLHGGKVAAHSDGPGLGAAFTVRLPLRRAAQVAPVPVAPKLPRGKRVLVIEDNEDAAESLRDVLEMMGHEVAVAHDGPEGLALARELHPEVVLCDIGLPQMDGYQVAAALRADAELRDVCLVAVTGYTGPEDRRRAAEAGFDQHVAKPPNLDALERIVAAGRAA